MVTPFYSLGNIETDITIHPKATVIDLSMDCKQLLALWGEKKNYDKPRKCVRKQRHQFASRVCIVKAMIFPVVMYGCES